MEKTALLFIDIQNDYFPVGKMPLSGSAEAAQNARQILDFGRSKGWPVIHVQHLATRPDATFFLPGTSGAEIYPLVNPADGEVIVVKNFPNSFRATTLETNLKALGVTHLVICGMMTHMCVDASVRAAKDLGWSCTVIADGCATRDLQWAGNAVPAASVHYSFLAALNGYYASVKNSDTWLKEL